MYRFCFVNEYAKPKVWIEKKTEEKKNTKYKERASTEKKEKSTKVFAVAAN